MAQTPGRRLVAEKHQWRTSMPVSHDLHSIGHGLRPIFFFLNDPAPPEIYPLPLPGALPIFGLPPNVHTPAQQPRPGAGGGPGRVRGAITDTAERSDAMQSPTITNPRLQIALLALLLLALP